MQSPQLTKPLIFPFLKKHGAVAKNLKMSQKEEVDYMIANKNLAYALALSHPKRSFKLKIKTFPYDYPFYFLVHRGAAYRTDQSNNFLLDQFGRDHQDLLWESPSKEIMNSEFIQVNYNYDE